MSTPAHQRDNVFDEAFLRKLERLDIVARKVRAGALRGERRSTKRGQSVEFADFRLYSPGDDVETVHFPCGPSLASYMVPNEDGRDVETILIGREGAVGGIVSQGFLPAYTRIMVKFAGPFVRLPVGKLDAAKAKSRTLSNIFARYADCMLAQVFQSTACNAIHSIEQRRRNSPLDKAPPTAPTPNAPSNKP